MMGAPKFIANKTDSIFTGCSAQISVKRDVRQNLVNVGTFRLFFIHDLNNSYNIYTVLNKSEKANKVKERIEYLEKRVNELKFYP